MENFDDLFEPQAPSGGGGPGDFDREAWAAKKQQEREGLYALVDDYAAGVGGREPPAFKSALRTYLDVQARFDRYSVTNAILIAAQKPDATKLADFDTWKANNVFVNKGESSISILEPGKGYQREDGSSGVAYNVKKVFDISQTDARPEGPPAMQPDDRLLLKALVSSSPYPCTISDELPENVNVRYIPEQKAILLRRGMDATAIFRGLSQEIARACIDRGEVPCVNPAFTAYCVSYMLCKRSGVPADTFRFDRTPEKYAQLDPQAIRAELSAMRAVSARVSADMNRVFEKAQSVVANSTSLASAQARKLARSVAPPSPTEPASLGFGGAPVGDGDAR